jgi:hypothetical protein
MRLRVLPWVLWFGLGCSEPATKPDGTTSAKAESSAAAKEKAAANEQTSKRIEALGSELVEAGFSDPRAVKKQDEVFQKVFADPEVSKAMGTMIEQLLADPAVKPHMDEILAAALKKPSVMAALQKIAAGAKGEAEISERVEKHVEAAMSAEAVNKAIDAGVASLMDAPEVDSKFATIFADADVSGMVQSAMADRDLAKAEEDLAQSLEKAESSGKSDAYINAWKTAAKADPAVKSAAADFAVAAVEGLADAPDLKRVFSQALQSPRTKTILAAAASEALREPEVKSAIVETFAALLGDAKNVQAIAQNVDKILKHPKFQARMKSALTELLSSKAGGLALQQAILSGMKRPEATKALNAFLLTVMKVAPKD